MSGLIAGGDHLDSNTAQKKGTRVHLDKDALRKKSTIPALMPHSDTEAKRLLRDYHSNNAQVKGATKEK